jgi:hypoxanthine phosphoribosyltransferase
MTAEATTTDSGVEIVYSDEEIARRLEELALEVKSAGLKNMLIVAILKGSFVFAADLIRALHRVGLEPEVDFLTLSSYKKSRTSSGRVEILRDLDLGVEGRNVLIVDDVLDSGRTLAFAKDLLSARGANLIRTCAPGKTGAARGRRRSRFCSLRMSGRVCCRVRHGRGSSLPRIAVRRPHHQALNGCGLPG